MNKHSKGPWIIVRGEDTTIANSQGQRIALEVSSHLRYEYREANAKLIASAPELLEALQTLLSSYRADFEIITGAPLNRTESVKIAEQAIDNAITTQT